ncbi:hypothetical protein [Arthrobacter sp. B2a2-09]|uniref:hypothetical protein n=1 Tax=Arthrobacter sp. B2a2-09 TaxID=2952822 RepID=UPI0022CD2E9F|nr:hypothetical protein [Arthrobacter sp. B2a2-09]MCZ9884936.1 hypothetical protein [Arthrobacter sp. B2a2-09]
MTYEVKLRVSQRTDMEVQLDRLVEHAILEALKNPGQGVLVTRHNADTFTVELSHGVPHGTIAELDARSEVPQSVSAVLAGA